METSMRDIRLGIARTPTHFEQIVSLQRRNTRSSLSAATQVAQGFVFAEHTPALLAQMAALSPQVIALYGDQVVGYSLTMTPAMHDLVPGLTPLFAQLEHMSFLGRRLAEHQYVVGGQVCVDPRLRGRGVIRLLYEETRRCVGPDVELCVTEIASRNVISLRAHGRLGFVEVGRYRDSEEEWVVVAALWRDRR